jgi:hypothetical protein
MSDRRGTWRGALALGVAALVMLPAAPRGGGAQSVAQLRARLVATIRNTNIVRDSIAAMRARRGAELPPDSMAGGSIRLRFEKKNLGPELQATLQSAAERAWRIADTLFGDAAAKAAGALPIVVNHERAGLIGSTASIDMVVLELSGPGGRSTQVHRPLTERRLADGILDLVGTLAMLSVPDAVIHWAGYWTPAHRLTGDDWRDAALDLATSSSSVTRTCYAGSLQSCESALGLTTVRDPLVEWYSPDGWRMLVGSWQARKDDMALAADRDACVVRKVAATCERLARSRPVPIPLTMYTRATLLGLALERGGHSAYARLLGAKGNPLQILAATAGVAPDALMDEWRSRLLAALPHSVIPTPAETGVLIAWTVLFGVVATRSRKR